MPLGWIDFSKAERSKVLSVLDLLSESGTLDELGIAPVRDGFANLFFPGTSTIQTRAKYFLIVPYALKDLEHRTETNPNRILSALDAMERQCGERLLTGSNTDGIIGSRSLRQNQWVKRTPSDIYWAGLRSYGIFKGGNISLSEYVRVSCKLKSQKATLARLGNRNDEADESDTDDKDAGEYSRMQFWRIPTYQEHWMDTLDIALTNEEGAFLKAQIISAFPNSMMACILRNHWTDLLDCRSFQELEPYIGLFPEDIQRDYALANDFSSFIFVVRTLYNVIISEGQNENANEIWDKVSQELGSFAQVDLESIFGRLGLYGNVFLCSFLRKTREYMNAGDVDGLEKEIRRRERELKQTRAKTMHPGEFDPTVWYGGQELDYRYGSARVIMRDIFESEGASC